MNYNNPLSPSSTTGAGLQLHYYKIQGDRDGGGRPEALFSLHLPGQTSTIVQMIQKGIDE